MKFDSLPYGLYNWFCHFEIIPYFSCMPVVSTSSDLVQINKINHPCLFSFITVFFRSVKVMLHSLTQFLSTGKQNCTARFLPLAQAEEVMFSYSVRVCLCVYVQGITFELIGIETQFFWSTSLTISWSILTIKGKSSNQSIHI